MTDNIERGAGEEAVTRESLALVMSGVFLKKWQFNQYNMFSNVTYTGEEKHGDFTLVQTIRREGKLKYAQTSELTSEFLNDPNFEVYTKEMAETWLVEAYEKAIKLKLPPECHDI